MSDVVIEIFRASPILFYTLAILIIVFFRDQIIDYFRIYILKKPSVKEVEEKKFKLKILETVASVRYVSDFNASLIIPDSDTFKAELNDIIDKSRKNQRGIVLDFSKVNNINQNAREAIRDVLLDTVDENNVSLLVVFPADDCICLHDELTKYIKKKSSDGVKVKIDNRSDRNG
ncbi:MAG TPA: hypothetical protein VMW44_00265 [Candidatus Bathyarchaeia archaeon]|nr:hypothetical protein [Candidatus Bathyarchaeia archaeon]